jgi:hypothetical protein
VGFPCELNDQGEGHNREKEAKAIESSHEKGHIGCSNQCP